jgi:hypothetical protein
MRPQGEDIAMTTTPPTLAQVLREVAECCLQVDGDGFMTLRRLLRERSFEIDLAALEAPACDAGREVPAVVDPPLCSCSCADKCPLGRRGSQTRCTADELRDAMLAKQEGVTWSDYSNQVLAATKATPAEPPPPAWDAEKWLAPLVARKIIQQNEHGVISGAGRIMKGLFNEAYTAGQRAAGVQVPEVMPEVIGKLFGHYRVGDITAEELWRSIGTHLTQTREG